MLYVLELVSRYKNITEAKKQFLARGNSERQFNEITNCINSLSVNIVCIPERWNIKSFPNPINLLFNKNIANLRMPIRKINIIHKNEDEMDIMNFEPDDFSEIYEGIRKITVKHLL